MAYNIAPSKQDTLVSGTSLKTINSESLLGSGDISISSGANLDLSNLTAPTAINQQLRGTLGSVSAPAYSFTGDDNTGIWSSAADTLNFSTAGSERLRISSSGKVAFNTTDTTYYYRFAFPGSTAGIAFHNGQVIFGTFGTGGNLSLRAQDPSATGGGEIFLGGSNRGDSLINVIQFSTGSAERARITWDGKVGIGTDTPTEKLHVAGNAKVAGDLTLSTVGSGLKIAFNGNSTAGIATGLVSVGSVIINTNKALTGSIIIVQPINTLDKPGFAVASINNGVSFTVDFSGNYNGDLAWFIINPA